MLDQPTNRRGGQQEVGDFRRVRSQAMIQIIAQHRWHHARRPVGRRRHDLAARRIFLVHGHGIDAEPVGRGMRLDGVGLALFHQLAVNMGGATLDAQAARQFAVLPQPALDASVHDRPDARHARLDIGLVA